jgi:hypothetical protein
MRTHLLQTSLLFNDVSVGERDGKEVLLNSLEKVEEGKL